MNSQIESPTKRPIEERDASETPLCSPDPEQDEDLSQESLNTTADQGSSTMDVTLLRTPRSTRQLSARTPPPQTPRNVLSPSISNQLSNSHRSRIVIQTPKTNRSNVSTPKKSPGDRRSSIRRSSNDKNSRTPSRTNTPRRTPRRQPTTPIILKAMQDGPTPRRNKLLLTPSKNRINSRYSPKKDLMLLGRLLSLEREDDRKRRKIEENSARALGSLYDFVSSQSQDSSSSNIQHLSQDSQLNSTLIQSQSQSQSQFQPNILQFNHAQVLKSSQVLTSTQETESQESVPSNIPNNTEQLASTQEMISQNSLDNLENDPQSLQDSLSVQQLVITATNGTVDQTISYTDEADQSRLSMTSDKTPRRARLSSRLSLETSLPNDSNIAIPEAIIREEGDYGLDLTDELGKDADDNDNPFYDKNDQFYGYDDYDYGDDDDDDNDDAGGDYANGTEERHGDLTTTTAVTANTTRQSVLSDTTTEHLDYSLLNQSPLPPPQFVTTRRRLSASGSKRPTVQQQNQFSTAMLKNLTKLFLPEDQQRKLQSPESLLLLQKISDEFIQQELEDLQSLAKHGKRKGINYDDVRLLMSRTQLDPAYDLLNLSNGSRLDDITTEVLKFGSTVFDREDVKEIEKVLYANTISDAKKIERKEAREEKRRLENEQLQEPEGNDDEDGNGEEDELRRVSVSVIEDISDTHSNQRSEPDQEESSSDEQQVDSTINVDQANGTIDGLSDELENEDGTSEGSGDDTRHTSEELEQLTTNLHIDETENQSEDEVAEDEVEEDEVKEDDNDNYDDDNDDDDDDVDTDNDNDNVIDVRNFKSNITLNFQGFEDEIVSGEDIEIPMEEDESE